MCEKTLLQVNDLLSSTSNLCLKERLQVQLQRRHRVRDLELLQHRGMKTGTQLATNHGSKGGNTHIPKLPIVSSLPSLCLILTAAPLPGK